MEKADGTLNEAAAFLQAPELAGSGSPSPAGDFVALLLFTRSLMSYIDMSAILGNVLRAEPHPKGHAMLEALQWVDRHMIVAEPSKRATIPEAVAMADRIRELAGVTLDPDGFAELIARHLRDAEHPQLIAGAPAGAGPNTLVLGPDASWVAGPDGTRHRLGRALRHIVLALVERHRTRPDAALTMWELLDAGWPGEKPAVDAGANRVYVTLSRLRGMGLRDIIERFDDGYRIAGRVTVRTASEAAA